MAKQVDVRDDATMDEFRAGNDFRDTLADRADAMAPGGYPLWHGWAIMDGFLAGIKYARENPDSDTAKKPKTKSIDPAVALKSLVDVVQELKDIVKGPPVPRIWLETDPVWARDNAIEVAAHLDLLKDALARAIAHCDAATHKTKKYQQERPALFNAIFFPPERIKKLKLKKPAQDKAPD